MAIAFDNIKGKTLFDIFQSILGYLAPPLAVTFLLSVFWRRTTKLAVNLILSVGSAFSLLRRNAQLMDHCLLMLKQVKICGGLIIF
jgi:Sodium:solute symporter family.